MAGDGIIPRGFDNLDKVFKQIGIDARLSLSAALFASAVDVANKSLLQVTEGEEEGHQEYDSF